MTWNFDDLNVGGQLQVGAGVPPAVGQGDKRINGSAYAEGPVVIGGPIEFTENEATLMVARTKNSDPDCTPADLSLKTKGNVFIEGDGGTPDALVVQGDQTINSGNLHTSNLLACAGQGCAWSGSTINVQGWKGFDIKHPTKEKHRLRYVCLEGPEGGVYYRGRVINKNYIDLPDYWEQLVDPASITVTLTPIGAHQSLMVKRVEPTRIHLQSNGGIPINAFFHVIGARADGEVLTPEYEGETPEDYPGNNNQYSIAGYHYDRRTL
mgnify:CR=1 FL=1